MSYQTKLVLEMIKRKLIGLFVFLLVAHAGIQSGFANDCYPVKSDRKLVYDEIDRLSQGEFQALNSYLIEVSNSTSNQIVVLLVDDFCGESAANFAINLGHEWGVGREKQENGIVIVIDPTKPKGKRKTHIAVGYGLEGVIPDATAKLIVENEMNPRFKQGSIAGGIKAGLDVLVPLAKKEFDYQAYEQQSGKKAPRIPYALLLVVLIFIIIKFSRARSYADQNGISLWSAFMLGSMMGGSGRGGGWDNFSSGDGGFGGFGGGGFGGGGAGGDW